MNPDESHGDHEGRDLVAELLAEAAAVRPRSGDPELEAVALAVLLEDVLDVPLRDQDIDLSVLTDAGTVRRLLDQGGGGR